MRRYVPSPAARTATRRALMVAGIGTPNLDADVVNDLILEVRRVCGSLGRPYSDEEVELFAAEIAEPIIALMVTHVTDVQTDDCETLGNKVLECLPRRHDQDRPARLVRRRLPRPLECRSSPF